MVCHHCVTEQLGRKHRSRK
uniref:Uncharacterized protein n=1 Tax=Anguilla anguilla TaxID=7936 RepID=A0A0E9PCK9_ANGAN